jgi:hypothetical protein
MTHFKIVYKVGNRILTTENRTHETTGYPSIKMITNCLHSILINQKIEAKYWDDSKAELYKNEAFQFSYRLSDTPN